jgi:phage terminase large subunit GpA-like protein
MTQSQLQAGREDEGLAQIEVIVSRAHRAWKPPPRLTLSQWADEHYYLSAISSAHVGRWRTLGYQRGIMDAITDPAITEVWVMKSARIGWTKILNAYVGFSIHQDPASVLIVQPTITDAKDYSKEELDPMFEDCPALEPIAFQKEVEEDKKKSNTMVHMRFAGGVMISLVGAVSGRGFRRISRKRILMDEVDAYEVSAGKDGDPVKLAIKRGSAFHDRKVLGGSTPLVKGSSRIESLFESGDQRRCYLPCPQCGHMDFLVWTRRDSGGHYMFFDSEKPRETAHFVCSLNGCVIEHQHKRQMIERCEWRATKPFKGKASFHIWAAYSLNAQDTWGQLAEEFVEANKKPEELRTFVNSVLGETWEERGDAPDHELLMARRELYPIGTAPAGVQFITVGVDVQRLGWYFEAVGWGAEKESWSLDAGFIPGDPNNEADWAKVNALLDRTFRRDDGAELPIMMLAIDSGDATQRVYSWVRTKPQNRVVAVKGGHRRNSIISKPTKIEVNINGKAINAGARLWIVGVSIAKSEFYGWLRLKGPAAPGAPAPPGYCHFPQYDEEYFRQITAEHLVTHKVKGYQVHEWQLLPGRENHLLDCRVYARAAASILGIDRMRPQKPAAGVAPEKPAVGELAPATAPAPGVQPASPPNRVRNGFWDRRRR